MGGEGIEPTRDIKPLVLQTRVSTLSRYPPLILTFYKYYIKNIYENQFDIYSGNRFEISNRATALQRKVLYEPSFLTELGKLGKEGRSIMNLT